MPVGVWFRVWGEAPASGPGAAACGPAQRGTQCPGGCRGCATWLQEPQPPNWGGGRGVLPGPPERGRGRLWSVLRRISVCSSCARDRCRCHDRLAPCWEAQPPSALAGSRSRAKRAPHRERGRRGAERDLERWRVCRAVRFRVPPPDPGRAVGVGVQQPVRLSGQCCPGRGRMTCPDLRGFPAGRRGSGPSACSSSRWTTNAAYAPSPRRATTRPARGGLSNYQRCSASGVLVALAVPAGEAQDPVLHPGYGFPGAARHCAFSPCPIRPADTRQPPPRRHRGGMRHISGRATSTDGPHVRRCGTRGERPAAAGGRWPQTGVKPCAGRFRPAEDGRGTITSQARSFGRAAAGCAANRLSCPPALTTGHGPSVFPGPDRRPVPRTGCGRPSPGTSVDTDKSLSGIQPRGQGPLTPAGAR